MKLARWNLLCTLIPALLLGALLAVEQGEPGALPVRLTAAPAEPVITDAFLDEVVRRVVERLSPGAARDVITDIVSQVAERLVREEIERIRKRQ